MLERPILANLQAKVINQDSVLLLSKSETYLLEGSLYVNLLSLIDGENTTEEIVRQLGVTYPDEYIYFALLSLESNHYIVESQSLRSNSVFNSFFSGSRKALASNPQYTVAVSALEGTGNSAKILSNLLQEQSINAFKLSHDEYSTPYDLRVVVVSDYLDNHLEAINQQSLIDETPWLLINPVGAEVWLGPVIYPKETGCWLCLATRLSQNIPWYRFQLNAQSHSTEELMPSGLQFGLAWAAIEISRLICTENHASPLKGNLTRFNLLTQAISKHRIQRRPQCSACGNREFSSTPQAIRIQPQDIQKLGDGGGYRVLSPAEVWKKFSYHIDPLTGIIQDIHKIDLPNHQFHEGLTLGLESVNHTYIARHYFRSVFSELNARALKQTLFGRSAGKGSTDLNSRVSALGEAFERYSGVYKGDELSQQNSLIQLGAQGIHPNLCMGFSQQQLNHFKEWNSNCLSETEYIAAPFDESTKRAWSPVYSLTEGRFKFLPTAYCYYGYHDFPSAWPQCWADSNGCASGYTLEEAILQGLLELIERDATAIWWYNRLSYPNVDISSFNDAYFNSIQKYYRDIGRELWILDLTHDLNIPVFCAISSQKQNSITSNQATTLQANNIIFGFGAHLDAKIAMRRALTELNQVLPNVLQQDQDGNVSYPSSADPLAIKWWQAATLENQPYLLPSPKMQRTATDYGPKKIYNICEAITYCQSALEALGLEVLVLEQTEPDIGFSVAKVFVPGLCHWWRRLGQNRLYDVPVKLGWLNEANSEDSLNPISLFM